MIKEKQLGSPFFLPILIGMAGTIAAASQAKKKVSQQVSQAQKQLEEKVKELEMKEKELEEREKKLKQKEEMIKKLTTYAIVGSILIIPIIIGLKKK